MDERSIVSVSELNEYLKNVFDSMPRLDGICVRGELSNYKIYPSGHHYFTMKDQGGSLRCVMFKSAAARLRFRPQDGMKVLAVGRVSVYPRDGVYQLYAASLTPDGVGDLQMAFEQLKEKLYKEGLFDPAHKKPIPAFPLRVGVVTSAAGAAIHDILRVLRKRWPVAKVILLPVRVQGAEAPPEIAAAIRYADRWQVCDTLIVGRGGGSMEDLWCFNDERVARAIFECSIPVISGVGHEPDVTIADFVADLRAATPSNAAELCAPDIAEIGGFVSGCAERSAAAMTKRLKLARERLDTLASARVLQDPKNYIDECRLMLDSRGEKMAGLTAAILAVQRRRFAELSGKLDAMSPLKVLSRGYAIALRQDGGVVRTARDVKPGDEMKIRLRADEIRCRVLEGIDHGRKENDV